VRKKIIINHNDVAAFHHAMKEARPLVQKNKKIRLAGRDNNKKTTTRQPDLPADQFTLNEEINAPELVSSEQFIAFKQNSISDKIFRKLRRGQHPVEAALDLHGMSMSDAKHAVQQFIQQSLQDKARVVLIIHGKGRHGLKPILKNKLNQWLRDTAAVLAFCSATALHGSRGAVYLLLKSNTEDDAWTRKTQS
jgi:DNA-nicking Smr family endonuclease